MLIRVPAIKDLNAGDEFTYTYEGVTYRLTMYAVVKGVSAYYSEERWDSKAEAPARQNEMASETLQRDGYYPLIYKLILNGDTLVQARAFTLEV